MSESLWCRNLESSPKLSKILCYDEALQKGSLMKKVLRNILSLNFNFLWSKFLIQNANVSVVINFLFSSCFLFWLKILKSISKLFLASPTVLCVFMSSNYSLRVHCVKNVQIRSFSGLYFPTFGLNTEIYEVNLRI